MTGYNYKFYLDENCAKEISAEYIYKNNPDLIFIDDTQSSNLLYLKKRNIRSSG